LRPYFRKNRELLHLLFTSAADTINAWLLSRKKHEQFKTGMVATLHTFGRALNWNPHIHMLMAMVKVGKTIPYQKIDFLPYDMLRKRFMTTLLYRLRGHVPKSVIDEMYRQYPHGFYNHAPPRKDIDLKKVANYITRYISRPVIAQKRILKFENDMVTFWYERHEDRKRVEETVHVFEFIKKVIVHIPDRYFNMVRYYGLYADNKHDLFLLHRKLPDHVQRKANRWQFRIICSFGFDPLQCKCGRMMHGTRIRLNTS